MIIKIRDKLSGSWTLRDDCIYLVQELRRQSEWLDFEVVSNGSLEDYTPLSLKLLFGYG